MPERELVSVCSPTLAGIKTGNIFTKSYETKDDALEDVRRMNRRFSEKGMRVLMLRYRQGKALIYLYRPMRLRRDLMQPLCREILESLGYPGGGSGRDLRYLMVRLSKEEEFPHEIGLFLGYPPEDVKAFMEHRKDYKCIGCWKVYSDEGKARAEFQKYDHCKEVYCREWQNGRSLEQLVVRTPERVFYNDMLA